MVDRQSRSEQRNAVEGRGRRVVQAEPAEINDHIIGLYSNCSKETEPKAPSAPVVGY